MQASIKHETGVKPIQARRVHSGALDELTSQRSTGKYSLLFFKLGQIALTSLVVIRLVVVQDSVLIKNKKNKKKRSMKTYDFHLLLAFLRSAGKCIVGSYQDDGYG